MTKKSDAGVDDVYDCPWLAYKSLMSISIAGIFRVFFPYIFFKTINAALIPANIAASDKKKLRGLSPRTDYTDRAAAAGRRS